jgi:hypothetical protein
MGVVWNKATSLLPVDIAINNGTRVRGKRRSDIKVLFGNVCPKVAGMAS